MSLSREDILRELELLPVWQLKAPLPNSTNEAVNAPLSENIQQVVTPIQEALPAPIVEVITKQDTVQTETRQVEPSPTQSSRLEQINTLDWQALQVCVQTCQACGLAQTRTQTVFGVGNKEADWLIIGEAPGAEEDKRGEPFVGAAGQLLDNMLAAIQLNRTNNVYIANVLKCRPPENRDPQGEEVKQCDPFLKRQVALIQPKLILALGRFAAQSLLNSVESIASMRGKLHDYHGIPVIVSYHPAYLLRNLPDKAKAWEDLCFAKKTMVDLQTLQPPQL
jgi:uracil-DNA glycosylase